MTTIFADIHVIKLISSEQSRYWHFDRPKVSRNFTPLMEKSSTTTSTFSLTLLIAGLAIS